MIHEESRTPIPLFVDTCTSGCGAVTTAQAYHMVFSLPPHPTSKLVYLPKLVYLVAVKVWAPIFSGQLVHLFSAVAIFQAGKGRNAFIQACARDIWLTCAAWDITLAVGHVSGTFLEGTGDAISCWHLGQPYQARVDRLLAIHAIQCISLLGVLFHLSQDL